MATNNFSKKLGKHLVDSTAIVAECTVPYALGEVYGAGMSDEVSRNARLLGAVLVYGGLGTAFAKGRELSRRVFRINETSNERLQVTHDALYNAGFNAVVGPLFYLASGSRDPQEIIIGTIVQTAIGFVNGAPMGYSVDTFRDLTGIEECKRPSYPKIIKNRSRNAKKTLATLIAAGTIGVTAGIYALTPDRHEDNVPQQYEQVIETNQDQTQP